MISPQRRHEIIDALRRGTVPVAGLDALAVNLSRFETNFDEELARGKAGAGIFKAVRGEYGSGKTFVVRWLQERAKQLGFATSEVQISETETPLHRLETVYRRLAERLSTPETREGALRDVVDGWFFALEGDVIAEGVDENDTPTLLRQTNELMEKRLAAITKTTPAFSAALRAYRRALSKDDVATADGLMAWVGAQPNVAATIKRYADIKGEIDHFGALNFLQGLLIMLRDSGRAGLVVVLDEVETLQRVRGDVREKALNALRQLIDEVDAGRFPGLYLVITGTPAFFEGPQGVQRLAPLAQRLHVDFNTDARFDNPRAVQIRLPGFSIDALCEVGRKVRDIYLLHCPNAQRIAGRADDAYVRDLAVAVTGKLGGKVGIAPRIFLKKLVADILDRIDQFDDFDPRQHYALTLVDTELSDVERQAAGAACVDDIEIEL